jgi:hypothetical protein
MVDWLARAAAMLRPIGANADTGKARRWRIYSPALAPIEVWFTPEVTRIEALAACEGAIRATPIHDSARRAATAAEADELRGMIAAILPDATVADRMEALTIALADPDSALDCFRTLALNAGGRAKTSEGPSPETAQRPTRTIIPPSTADQTGAHTA